MRAYGFTSANSHLQSQAGAGHCQSTRSLPARQQIPLTAPGVRHPCCPGGRCLSLCHDAGLQMRSSGLRLPAQVVILVGDYSYADNYLPEVQIWLVLLCGGSFADWAFVTAQPQHDLQAPHCLDHNPSGASAETGVVARSERSTHTLQLVILFGDSV